MALYGMLGWLERLASDEKYFEKKYGARGHLEKVCWLDPPSGIYGIYSGDLTQLNVKCPIAGQTYHVKSPALAPVATRGFTWDLT